MLVLLLFSIFPSNRFSIASNMVDFFGYLLTNKRKTAIIDDFSLFWAFLAIFHSVLRND